MNLAKAFLKEKFSDVRKVQDDTFERSRVRNTGHCIQMRDCVLKAFESILYKSEFLYGHMCGFLCLTLQSADKLAVGCI
ncbi:hypothetical protein BFW41_10005 [Aeromonas hydrophila]|nr:hypothetical protein BFW41_10005 [Aeromonas hydrophila]